MQPLYGFARGTPPMEERALETSQPTGLPLPLQAYQENRQGQLRLRLSGVETGGSQDGSRQGLLQRIHIFSGERQGITDQLDEPDAAAQPQQHNEAVLGVRIRKLHLHHRGIIIGRTALQQNPVPTQIHHRPDQENHAWSARRN